MEKLVILLWLPLFICGAAQELRGAFDGGAAASDAEMHSPGVMTWLSDRYNSVNTFFGGARAELQALRQDHDSLCGDITEPLSGSCSNLATCLISGGTRVTNTDSCGPFGLGGVCCKHSLKCGGNMNTRIGFWESDGYPQVSNKDGPCTLRVSPVNDVCYLRIEFLDMILTAPRADACEGNTLTIRGQVEGSSGTICGNLNGHETFVRVNEGTAGIFRVYDELLLHLDIQDEFHKYKMKLTQIRCDQELNSLVRVETTSDPFRRRPHSSSNRNKKVKILQRVYVNDQKPESRKQTKRKQRYNWLKKSVESLPGVLGVVDLVRENNRDARSYNNQGRAQDSINQYTEDDDIELLKLLNMITGKRTSISHTPNTLETLNTTISTIFTSSGVKEAKWEIISLKDIANTLENDKNNNREKRLLMGSFDNYDSNDNSESISRESRKNIDDAQSVLRSLSSLIEQISGRQRQPETRQLSHRKKNPTYLVRKNMNVKEAIQKGFPEDGYVVLISPLKDLPSLTNKVKKASDENVTRYQMVNTKSQNENTISEHRRKVLANALKRKHQAESVKEQTNLKSKPNHKKVYALTNNQQSQLASYVNQHLVTEDTSERVKYTVGNSNPSPPSQENNRRPQYQTTSTTSSKPNPAAPSILANRIKTSNNDNMASNEDEPSILNTDGDTNTDGLIVEEDVSFYGHLVLRNEVDEYFFCSATLITPRHALTTASCVMRKGFDVGRYKTHVVFKQDDIGLPTTRSGASMFNAQEKYLVVKTVFHPMYRHGRFHYDVAVLQLDSDVYGARPIRLAASSNSTSLIRDDITIMGHGVRPGTQLMDFRAYGRHLSYMNTKQVLTVDCADSYRSSPRKRFTYMETLIKPELMCVSSEDDTQMCEGDQGAPAVINFGIEADPLLVGIAAGNDHNCIGVRQAEIGQYPDVIVPISPSVELFIRMATSNIRL